MAQGLFRKKGYFSEEGLDRQLQDLEQDVDDSLRALSEQVDSNASEGAQKIAEVQTQITRAAGTASSASSSTAALSARVTTLEATAPYLYVQVDNGAYPQNTDMPLTLSESRGSITLGANSVTIDKAGLYTVTLSIEVQNSNTSNPRQIIIDLRRSGTAVTRMDNTRWSATTTDLVLIESAWSGYFSQGQIITFRCASGGTTTVTGGSLIRSNATIARVGN